MIDKVRQHRYQVLFLAVIFLLYLLNGIGVLVINLRSGLDVNMNLGMLASLISATMQNPLQLQTVSLAVVFATGIFLCLFLPVAAPVQAAIATILSGIPHVLINLASTNIHLIFPFEYSLLIILILFSTNALVIYFIETHSRQKIIAVFGKYVPPYIVDQISKQPAGLNMEGDSKRLTVFFCDLQNFTNVAEQLNPKQLAMLLNEYFSEMTEILYRHGATIDKYIGDSIMAFWGAPVEQQDHAERAVSAALAMQATVKPLAERFIKRGWPGPTMGMGINTGLMSVGNMGSRYRIAYTVIGDAVNLAARIETLTRAYGVPILVTEATRNECPNIAFREIDTVQVKGKHNLARLYQPVCRLTELSDPQRARLKLHQEGIEHYQKHDLPNAARIFRQLRDTDREDTLYPAMIRIISSKDTINN